jgi:hypothetical protein
MDLNLLHLKPDHLQNKPYKESGKVDMQTSINLHPESFEKKEEEQGLINFKFKQSMYKDRRTIGIVALNCVLTTPHLNQMKKSYKEIYDADTKKLIESKAKRRARKRIMSHISSHTSKRGKDTKRKKVQSVENLTKGLQMFSTMTEGLSILK